MSRWDKDQAMSDTTLHEMQKITRLAAEPRAPGDSTKAAIDRAARSLRLTYRRARSFWYATPGTAVRAWEADRVRAEELQIIAAKRRRLERELQDIAARLAAREMGKHAMAGKKVGVLVHRVSEGVVACRRVAGGEGVIEDARQGSLLG
jgi:Mg-chelatase subunit ChlI